MKRVKIVVETKYFRWWRTNLLSLAWWRRKFINVLNSGNSFLIMFYVKSETFFSSFFVAETLHTKLMQALSHTITKSYIIICMYIENRMFKKKHTLLTPLVNLLILPEKDTSWLLGVGCCPYKEGVCCQDRLHCCPHGTL